jgi:hypothetical protein
LNGVPLSSGLGPVVESLIEQIPSSDRWAAVAMARAWAAAVVTAAARAWMEKFVDCRSGAATPDPLRAPVSVVARSLASDRAATAVRSETSTPMLRVRVSGDAEA